MTETSPSLAGCSGAIDTTSSIIIATGCGICSVVAVFGNVLVMLSVYRTRSLQTISNYFLVSLSAADLLVGAVIFPLVIVKTIWRVWTGDLVLALEVLAIQASLASTFNLCSVSIDRYIAVKSVLRYTSLMTPKRALIIIILLWMASLIISSSRLYANTPVEQGTIFLVTKLFDFVIPLSVICFCYVHIFQAAKRQRRQIVQQNTASAQRALMVARNTKAACTIGIVIGVYFFFYISSFVTALVQMSNPDPCFQIEINKVWFWVGPYTLLNSVLNPWIYAARSTEFRTAFKRIIGMKTNRNNHDLASQSGQRSLRTTNSIANG